MADILREVDRANEVLQRLCMLRNLVEVMRTFLIHQDWEVEFLDCVECLVNLVETIFGFSNVIVRSGQMLQTLNLFLHFVVICLSLNAIHCIYKSNQPHIQFA